MSQVRAWHRIKGSKEGFFNVTPSLCVLGPSSG